MAQLVKNLPAMWEPWVAKIPWRREQLPSLVFWPGEFHGLYSPRGRRDSNTTDFHIKYKETFPFILLAHKLILKQKGP